MKLSVVIPSYKDPILHKTIDSLLESSKLGDELEIIVVLDGYWPEQLIKDDKRIKIIHLGRNRGMRGAINAGVAVSKGEYIMRTDEHCMFAKGYDVTLIKNCAPNWIVTPRRFFLDPNEWKVMDIDPIDYERLEIQEVSKGIRKFAGVPWISRTKERKSRNIDGTMAMQGSCWIMPHKWWDDIIGELDTERYGPLYQDSHEMVFKTWKAGGRFMVNKHTWFAHKHRSFPRSHADGTKENPSIRKECWAHSLKVWGDYYTKEIRPRWKI